MNLKYILGVSISIPLIPLMYYHGKVIRSKIPELPEASGTEGVVSINTKDSLNILAIGESTIAGVGVQTQKEGLVGSLAKELSELLDSTIHWKVYAKSGYTANQVRELIIPQIVDKKIDLIVIGLGGNDAFKLHSPKKWRNSIQGLIDDLRKNYEHCPIVFANMPPIKEFPAFTPIIKFTIGNLVEILGAELEKMTTKQTGVFYNSENVTLTSWAQKTNIETSDLFSDGVHPSKLAYQSWAKDLADFIFETKEIRDKLL